MLIWHDKCNWERQQKHAQVAAGRPQTGTDTPYGYHKDDDKPYGTLLVCLLSCKLDNRSSTGKLRCGYSNQPASKNAVQNEVRAVQVRIARRTPSIIIVSVIIYEAHTDQLLPRSGVWTEPSGWFFQLGVPAAVWQIDSDSRNHNKVFRRSLDIWYEYDFQQQADVYGVWSSKVTQIAKDQALNQKAKTNTILYSALWSEYDWSHPIIPQAGDTLTIWYWIYGDHAEDNTSRMGWGTVCSGPYFARFGHWIIYVRQPCSAIMFADIIIILCFSWNSLPP